MSKVSSSDGRENFRRKTAQQEISNLLFFMSRNFELEIESLISQLQPLRLEVLQAEQQFRRNSTT